jgi:hypothetical protein
MNDEEDGTCELVIYCYNCKNFWQLNPEMIALALATNASVWDVYKYILTTKCKTCEKNDIPILL